MNPTESFLVLLLAGLATAIALGVVTPPTAILHSSVSQAFLLVMTLVLFAYSPVVGIAAIALFAILMFKRNVQKTSQYTNAMAQYSWNAVRQQEYPDVPPQQPVVHISQPREYSQYNDHGKDASHLPTGTEEYYASPEEVGTYPLHKMRPITQGQTYTAAYRPSNDMGENDYASDAPTLENYKTTSFAY